MNPATATTGAFKFPSIAALQTFGGQFQFSSSHQYPGITLGGQSTAHLGDVHYHAQPRTDAQHEASLQRKEFLSALAYENINARRVQLAQQSAGFLEWIWQEQMTIEDTGIGGPGFVEWLQSDAPKFWITGKPGSGKSTLIKHIAEDARCKRLLEYADPQRCEWMIVHFYFNFREGTQRPNAIEGLLRSILFQLCQASTTALDAVRQDPIGQGLQIQHNDLDTSQLCHLLRKAASTILNAHNRKICGFIDGLDEYNGHPNHLLDLIHALIENGVQKLCLASRPEHIYHQYLCKLPHFKVESYNEGTIRAYTKQVLTKVAEVLDSPYQLNDLCERVVEAADGVVLWANLAIEQLVRRMLSGEPQEELDRALAEIPPELDAVYARRLGNIDSNYIKESAVMLHLIFTAPKPPAMRQLHCAMLFLRDECGLETWPKSPMSDEAFLLRLRARTGSLIQVDEKFDWLWQRAGGEKLLSLFHRSFYTYLENSQWTFTALQGIGADMSNLWLSIFADCILNNDLTARVIMSWEYVDKLGLSEIRQPLEIPIILQPSEMQKQRNVEEALKSANTPSSSASLLPYAISLMPTYLRFDPDQPGEKLQRALGSNLMGLHGEGITFFASSDRCNCFGGDWAARRSVVGFETWYKTFTYVERSYFLAIRHGLFHTFLAWAQQKGRGGLQSLGCQKLLHTMFKVLCGPEVFRPFDEATIVRVTQVLDTSLRAQDLEEFVGQSRHSIMVNVALRAIVGRWSWSEPVFALANAGMDARPQSPYNLIFCWLCTRNPEAMGLWLPGSALDVRLSILIDGGCGINSRCSWWGPPLHSLVEMIRRPGIAGRILSFHHFQAQMECLLRHDARLDAHGPKGDVLQTAHKICAELRAERVRNPRAHVCDMCYRANCSVFKPCYNCRDPSTPRCKRCQDLIDMYENVASCLEQKNGFT